VNAASDVLDQIRPFAGPWLILVLFLWHHARGRIRHEGALAEGLAQDLEALLSSSEPARVHSRLREVGGVFARAYRESLELPRKDRACLRATTRACVADRIRTVWLLLLGSAICSIAPVLLGVPAVFLTEGAPTDSMVALLVTYGLTGGVAALGVWSVSSAARELVEQFTTNLEGALPAFEWVVCRPGVDGRWACRIEIPVPSGQFPVSSQATGARSQGGSRSRHCDPGGLPGT